MSKLNKWQMPKMKLIDDFETCQCEVKVYDTGFEEALFNYQPYRKNDKKCCPQGHEYTTENTGYTSQGYRYCKTCKELKRPIYNAHRREQRRLSKNG